MSTIDPTIDYVDSIEPEDSEQVYLIEEHLNNAFKGAKIRKVTKHGDKLRIESTPDEQDDPFTHHTYLFLSLNEMTRERAAQEQLHHLGIVPSQISDELFNVWRLDEEPSDDDLW